MDNRIKMVTEMVNNGYHLFGESIAHFALKYDEDIIRNFYNNFFKWKRAQA